jgi:hypothetical protein
LPLGGEYLFYTEPAGGIVKLIVALLLFLCSFSGPASAADAGPRPTIAFFYIDTLNVNWLERSDIKRETVGRFEKKYVPAYNLRSGDAYGTGFGVSRFTDLGSLDRFDLLPRLAADGVDYAVFYTVMPLQTKKDTLLQLVTTKSRVHVRVFDLRKNAYVCDSGFAYSSQWAWPNGHFAKLYDDVDGKVFSNLFPIDKQ